MKRLSGLLLFLGLSIVPALVLAAPGSTVIPGLAVAEGDSWSPPSQDVCSEATPAGGAALEAEAPQDCETGLPTDAAAPVSMERKPCKACQLQPWCACTYNGYPRISCDPCCYQSYAGPICTS